jgi:hypothetical protein
MRSFRNWHPGKRMNRGQWRAKRQGKILHAIALPCALSVDLNISEQRKMLRFP